MSDIKQKIRDYVETYSDSYLIWEDVVVGLGGAIVSEELIEQSRWNVTYEIVMRFTEEGEDGENNAVYVRVYDVRGSTEYQDGEPIEDTLDDLVIVEPFEKVVVGYRPI